MLSRISEWFCKRSSEQQVIDAMKLCRKYMMSFDDGVIKVTYFGIWICSPSVEVFRMKAYSFRGHDGTSYKVTTFRTGAWVDHFLQTFAPMIYEKDNQERKKERQRFTPLEMERERE